MNKKTCKHCGKEVDKKAVICPSCGCRVSNKIVIAIVLLFIIVIGTPIFLLNYHKIKNLVKTATMSKEQKTFYGNWYLKSSDIKYSNASYLLGPTKFTIGDYNTNEWTIKKGPILMFQYEDTTYCFKEENKELKQTTCDRTTEEVEDFMKDKRGYYDGLLHGTDAYTGLVFTRNKPDSVEQPEVKEWNTVIGDWKAWSFMKMYISPEYECSDYDMKANGISKAKKCLLKTDDKSKQIEILYGMYPYSEYNKKVTDLYEWIKSNKMVVEYDKHGDATNKFFNRIVGDYEGAVLYGSVHNENEDRVYSTFVFNYTGSYGAQFFIKVTGNKENKDNIDKAQKELLNSIFFDAKDHD